MPTDYEANRKLWIDALRSGDYTQGKGALCWQTGEGELHCCLGVLCEVFIKAGGALTKESTLDGKTRYDNLSGGVPDKVIEWVGFKSSKFNDDARHTYDNHLGLADMNDYAGLDFNGIANIIEHPEYFYLVEDNATA